jgi:hypothetical protein
VRDTKGAATGAYVENVLIVGQGDHELHNQFTTTSSDSPSSSPVGVLPVDSIILFMETDDVFRYFAIAFSVRYDTVKILQTVSAARRLRSTFTHLDDTQAIASKFKIVGCMSNSAITKIKRLLSVEWRTRISVRHGLKFVS